MKTCRSGMRAPGQPSCARGFSIVELLTVILIIALLVSIVVPVLGKARRAAKVTTSRQLATQIATAASTFQAEQRRYPGYYSPRDMGAKANKDRGMSAMENAMLDLAGGIVATGQKGPPGAVALSPFPPLGAGSRGSEVVWVNPSLIGSTSAANSSSKGYFTPPARNFVAQKNEAGLNRQVGTLGGSPLQIPDIVDDFGTPMLVWSEDESAGQVKFDNGTGPGENNFARDYSDTKPARFYWGANACFLKSNALGKLAKNQVRDTAAQSSKLYSLIGGEKSEASSDPRAEAVTSLAGVLGNPGFVNLPASPQVDTILPTGARGKFIVHVADPDGYYFWAKSKGVGEVGTGSYGTVLKFGYNFLMPDGTTVRESAPGQATSVDITSKFEDYFATAGS